MADAKEAMEAAVDECIRQGVLKDFLERRRNEVVANLLAGFTEKEREELYRSNGMIEGRAEGLAEGIAQLTELANRMAADNRQSDFFRAMRDPAYRQACLEEYHLA